MTIGERIRSIRKSKGISQTELASAIKISKQNLYKYETNIITNIPSDKIEAIAEYLDVSPSEIMGWNEPYSTEELIDVYIRGAKKWATDFRFNERQRTRITEYLADSAARLKKVVNAMANSDQENGKILPNTELQMALDDISLWTSNGLKYVNGDYSNDPFDETNIREQYLSAISKLSRRDQVAWLIRLQDYIEDTANKEEAQ